MSRNRWMYQAAMTAVMAITLQACASSPMRMPPGTPVGYAAPAYAPTPAVAAPATYYAPVAVTPASVPPPAAGITGLTEREPDLCGAKSYARSIGQPASAITSLGLTKTFRVVEYRGIEPQVYDPNRIVFRLDAAGTITQIDCG